MASSTQWLWSLTAVLTICLASCGGPAVLPRGSVRGHVTWDGTPIKEGTITFVPISGTPGSPAAAIIRDGQYLIEAESGPVVGMNRVEIIANRETGETIPAVPPATAEIRQVEQFIPDRFNRSSTLEQDVVAGENEFDFDLVAK